MAQVGVNIETLVTPTVPMIPTGSLLPPPFMAAESIARASTAAKSARNSSSISGEVCSSMFRENSTMPPACFGDKVTWSYCGSEADKAAFSATHPVVAESFSLGMATLPVSPLRILAPKRRMTNALRNLSMN